MLAPLLGSGTRSQSQWRRRVGGVDDSTTVGRWPATRQITDWPTETVEMRRKERRDNTTLICWIFVFMVLLKIVIGKQRKQNLFGRVYPGFSCIACPAGEGAPREGQEHRAPVLRTVA